MVANISTNPGGNANLSHIDSFGASVSGGKPAAFARDVKVEPLSTQTMPRDDFLNATKDRKVDVLDVTKPVLSNAGSNANDVSGVPMMIEVGGQLTHAQRKSFNNKIDGQKEWTEDDKKDARKDVKEVDGFLKCLFKKIKKNASKVMGFTLLVSFGVAACFIPVVGVGLATMAAMAVFGVFVVWLVDMDTSSYDAYGSSDSVDNKNADNKNIDDDDDDDDDEFKDIKSSSTNNAPNNNADNDKNIVGHSLPANGEANDEENKPPMKNFGSVGDGDSQDQQDSDSILPGQKKKTNDVAKDSGYKKPQASSGADHELSSSKGYHGRRYSCPNVNSQMDGNGNFKERNKLARKSWSMSEHSVNSFGSAPWITQNAINNNHTYPSDIRKANIQLVNKKGARFSFAGEHKSSDSSDVAGSHDALSNKFVETILVENTKL